MNATANATNLIGRTVTMKYGAYFPEEEAVIVGFESDEHGFRFVTMTKDGTRDTFPDFADRGIGVYLK